MYQIALKYIVLLSIVCIYYLHQIKSNRLTKNNLNFFWLKYLSVLTDLIQSHQPKLIRIQSLTTPGIQSICA